MKWILILAALPCILRGQKIEGTWQGILIPPSGKGEVRLAFTIVKEGEAYGGRFYNLNAGRQVNLGSITLRGTAVAIVIPGNGMTYDGKLEEDGNSVTGTLTQGTNPVPLLLKRATGETAWELPPLPAPPKGLLKDVKPEFEVATIKPSANPAAGPGFNVSARELRARSVSLVNLITFSYQLHATQIAGLPRWAEDDKYEIVASFPSGGDPTDEQIFVMLQTLMKDRFNLFLHPEKRELSAYVINIGKNGPEGLKLVKNTTNGARVNAQGLGRTTFSGVTMANFASQLQQRVLDRPVLDQTGLTDRYDFTLNWTPDQFQYPALPAARRAAAAASADALPDLFAAFREQLGLRLEARKVAADVFVIDKVSKPSPN